jgi:3-carboxy-cis,cis-muconate cycloisomerase
MTNLLWPGDQRAAGVMTDQALLDAMVAVESAWLATLAASGLAPAECADAELGNLVGPQDCEPLAVAAEDGANPVIGMVAMLRDRADPAIAGWIHRGLTSQDVLDTALMLTARAAIDHLKAILAEQISSMITLAETHRHTAMAARTLTQHAVPTTFGAKAAVWLNGVVDAYQRVDALQTPAQIGGAAGTLAATTELAALLGGGVGGEDAPRRAARLARDAAAALGLPARTPWHTTRGPVTSTADALVACTDSWGRIAADVLTLARPEIAELSEPAGTGRGHSSTMPQKRNPVLSILIRRAALAAPPLAATLHTAAALANDERPDGAWHTEWDTLRVLARRTVVAGSQCRELVAGLGVDPRRMADTLAGADLLAEQRATARFLERPPSPGYFGTVDGVVDDAVGRARGMLRGPR